MASSSSFESSGTIKSVDLTRWYAAATAGGRRAVAQEILDGLSRQGFLYVKGHGVPQPLIDRIFAGSEEFFSKPLEHKMKWATKSPEERGYVSLSQEKLNPNREESDCKEAYVSLEHSQSSPNCCEKKDVYKLKSADVSAIKMPPEFSTRSADLYEFSTRTHGVLKDILEALSLALEIPEDLGGSKYLPRLHDYNADSGDLLRLLSYPPVKMHGVRAGGHTDYGSLTALFQQDVGGLELFLPDEADGVERWIPANPVPSTLIINAGDLLEFWTGGLIQSTVHRVVAPTDEKWVDRTRYSVVYFMHAADDTPLTLIKSPVVDTHARANKRVAGKEYAGPELMGSITAREHLFKRLEAIY
ncbi:hypothetical protein HK101_009171 [Irineochytrium annulatum]|nr:hypothetical protein HK101_009171 [Irineochytrium annulatum]